MSKNDVVLDALHKLVDALDQQVPNVERLGGTRIARDAGVLREEVVNRIDELCVAQFDRDTRETERSGGVMTDDGGPLKIGG